MNLHFALPISILLLLPLAFAAYRMLRRAARPKVIPFAPLGMIPRNGKSLRIILSYISPFLFILGAVLVVVALMRPQTAYDREHRSVDSIAIAMVVDVSGSMQALDLAKNPNLKNAPTRLDVVKEEFKRFIERRPDDLVSLITFGGFAHTRSPLTLDHHAVLQYLSAVSIPGMGEEDEGRQVSQEETLTAVGDGLVTACARLRELDLKTKIVILLSDGVSNAGITEPGRAAEIAKELGIKVYTIGVGSNSANVPIKAVDARGRTVVVPGRVEFNEEELKHIAHVTEGRYYSVKDRAGFEKVLEKIDGLEKTRVERDVYHNYNECFVYPLHWGAVLVIISSFINLFFLKRVF